MSRELWIAAAALAVAYLLGGIPFSLVIGRVFFRRDLHREGSGNLGATNAFRVLGPVAGAAVGLLDIGKGAAGAAVAKWLLSHGGATMRPDWFLLLVVFAAMAGHTFSPYVGFKGGKGISAAGGALLVVMPLVAAILFVVFGGLIAVGRVVSVASIAVAMLFPVLVWTLYSRDPLTVALATLAGALAVWRHRSNISRIIKGEEPRVGRVRAEREAGQ